jgi:hypothetical protein
MFECYVRPVSLHPRPGQRPDVSIEGPQRQLTQCATPELWGMLVSRVFAFPGVVEGHSQVSPASSRAVFFEPDLPERMPETSLAPGQRLEPAHLHGVDDTSIHLCLPRDRAIALVDLGWGQMHAYGDYGTELLVYGPRSDVELDTVLSIIEESLAFARG